MDRIDLHTHSTASDGSFSPSQVMNLAVEAGLKAVALTDHDTIKGLKEAATEAKRLHLEFVPGVEISLNYKEGSLHMLGYHFNPEDSALKKKLNELQRWRNERNEKILKKFKELGIEIAREDLIRAVGGEDGLSNLGRPHLAKILIEKKVVKDFEEAFDKYLGDGKPAHVPKMRLEPIFGIEMIHAAKGLAVLAHPLYSGTKTRDEVETLVRQLKDAGLDGIECYYSDHSPRDTNFYQRLARKYGLLVTGGSDFHGEAKANTALGVGKGSLAVPYRLGEELYRFHYQKYSLAP